MALSSLIGNKGSVDFGDAVEAALRRRPVSVPPIKSDSWLRISSLGNICPREEVLCSNMGVDRSESVTPDLGMVFEVGHAIHWMLQNSTMPATGRFVGSWRCTWCGEVYGSMEEGLVLRPESCIRCGAIAGEEPRLNGKPDKSVRSNAFLYVEQWVGDYEYMIGGHPDGFMVMGDAESFSYHDLTVMEFKTASKHTFYKYKKAPDFTHVIQCQLYMWLTGLRSAKIVYIDKGEFGMGAMVDHDLEYDEGTVERVKSAVKEIRGGVMGGPVPVREACASRNCQRAMNCKVADVCFSE